MDVVDLGQRSDADRGVGDDAEPALRAEHQVAQVWTSGGTWERRQPDGPRGRLEPAAREELVHRAEADALLAHGPGGDPAAQRRQLERLGEVPERPALRAEQRLDTGPGVPAPKVARREARSSAARPLRRDRSTVSTGCSDVGAVTPPTTLVPPPKGTRTARLEAAAASTSRTSDAERGRTTASGAAPSWPERVATRSGNPCPRACRTRSSPSVLAPTRWLRRDGGRAATTSASAASRESVPGPSSSTSSWSRPAGTARTRASSPHPFHRRMRHPPLGPRPLMVPAEAGPGQDNLAGSAVTASVDGCTGAEDRRGQPLVRTSHGGRLGHDPDAEPSDRGR